jgi:hypothetical protein
MKPNLLAAYASLIMGSLIASLLDIRDLQRMRALAIAIMAVGFWLFSCAAVFIACMDALRLAVEAVERRLLDELWRQPAPAPEIERYQLTVEPATDIVVTIERRDLEALAAGLLAGRPFSEREWSSKLHGNFRYIQDEFERRELVTLKGKRRELNGRGRRAMLQVYYGHSGELPPLPL